MLSGKNSVISDWPGAQFRSCSSRSRKSWINAQACRSDKGWRFFSLYGCEKNTTACPIAWTGYVRPATINQAMDGPIACFCSDPIPPVAVATDLPAEHVLSRSAGSKASSSITIDIISHHPPYEASEFSGYGSNGNIPFLSTMDQFVVFPAKPNIGLVSICYDCSGVSHLSSLQCFRFLPDCPFADTATGFNLTPAFVN